MSKIWIIWATAFFALNSWAVCFTDAQVAKKVDSDGESLCTRFEGGDAYCSKRYGSKSGRKAYITTSLCSYSAYSSKVRSRSSLVVASALDEIEVMLKRYDRTSVNVWSHIELSSFNQFTTGDTKALFDKFNTASEELYNFSKNVPEINSKDGVDAIEYARKYYGLLTQIHMLYAKTAHESGNLKNWSWNIFNKLKLKLAKVIGLELAIRYGLKAKHIDEFTLEFVVGETDKIQWEFLAISSPETKTDYAKLVQHLSLQHILTNHYAVKRMMTTKRFSEAEAKVDTPNVTTCGNDLLSYRSNGTYGSNGSISTIPYYKETEEYDFYHFTYKRYINKIIEDLFETDMATETNVYKWLDEVLVSSGIKEFLTSQEIVMNEETGEEDLIGAGWSLEQFNEWSVQVGEAIRENEKVFWTQSQEQIAVSLFPGDKLTKENIINRVIEDSVRIRSEAIQRTTEMIFSKWEGSIQAAVLKSMANRILTWSESYKTRAKAVLAKTLETLEWKETEKAKKYDLKMKEVIDIFKVSAHAIYYAKYKKLRSNLRDKNNVLIDDINPRTPQELRTYFEGVKGAAENYKLHYSTVLNESHDAIIDEIFEKVNKKYEAKVKATQEKTDGTVLKVKELPNILYDILVDVFKEYAKENPYDFYEKEVVPSYQRELDQRRVIQADNTRVVLYTPIYEIPKVDYSSPPQEDFSSGGPRNVNDILNGVKTNKGVAPTNFSKALTAPADSVGSNKSFYDQMAGNLALKDSLRQGFKKKSQSLRPMVAQNFNTDANGNGGILTQVELGSDAEVYDTKAQVIYHIASILRLNYLWDVDAAQKAKENKLNDFWGNSRQYLNSAAHKPAAFFDDAKGKLALAQQMIQQAVTGAPLLGMDNETWIKSAKVSGGSGNYSSSTITQTTVKETQVVYQKMLETYKGGGVFDETTLQGLVKKIVVQANKQMKGKVKTFCQADYSNYKYQSINGSNPYREMFNGVTEVRDGLKAPAAQDPNLAKKMARLDNEVRKDMRGTSEIIAEDWDDFLMTFMVILIIVSVCVIPFLGSALALSPAFIMGLNLIVDGVDLVITATHIYARANQYFYEMPAQIKFQQALAETQLDSNNLTTWESVRTNKSAMKTQQTMFIAFLPLEAIVGVQFRASLLRFTGSKGSKILKKWGLKTKGWGRPAETVMQPTATKALIKENGVIGGLFVKAKNSVDNAISYMPRYTTMTATELKNVARVGLNSVAKEAGELGNKPWLLRADAEKFLGKVKEKFKLNKDFADEFGQALVAGKGKNITNAGQMVTNPRFYFHQLTQNMKYSTNLMFPKTFFKSLTKGKFTGFISKYGDAIDEMNKLRTKLVRDRVILIQNVMKHLDTVEELSKRAPELLKKDHDGAFDFFQSLLSEKELRVLDEITMSAPIGSQTKKLAKVFRQANYIQEVMTSLHGIKSGVRYGYKFLYPNLYDPEVEDLITKEFAQNNKMFLTKDPLLLKKDSWWENQAKMMLETQEGLFQKGVDKAATDLEDLRGFYEGILLREGATIKDMEADVRILNREVPVDAGDEAIEKISEKEIRSNLDDQLYLNFDE